MTRKTFCRLTNRFECKANSPRARKTCSVYNELKVHQWHKVCCDVWGNFSATIIISHPARQSESYDDEAGMRITNTWVRVAWSDDSIHSRKLITAAKKSIRFIKVRARLLWWEVLVLDRSKQTREINRKNLIHSSVLLAENVLDSY